MHVRRDSFCARKKGSGAGSISLKSATGTAWERTPWHATQPEALRRAEENERFARG